jgi:hypothetical protein
LVRIFVFIAAAIITSFLINASIPIEFEFFLGDLGALGVSNLFVLLRASR